jgi:hypothetical protein
MELAQIHVNYVDIDEISSSSSHKSVACIGIQNVTILI